MCGIFAYSGSKNATKTVFSGLCNLQYRGYDSWGIASLTSHRLSVVKDIGALPSELSRYAPSSLAIGHTRWATHGGVTKNNAHPHLSCDGRFAVVHNGIIENFESIKNNLKNKHTFKSTTDTELIVHYLEENIKNHDPFSVFQSLVSELTGHSAIVVLDKLESEIYFFRSGSPLVLGKTGDELYVSSDLPSLTKYASDIYPLRDGEVFRLSALPSTLSWVKVQAKLYLDPGIKTKYHMESEIDETKSIISGVSHYVVSDLKRVWAQIRVSRQVLLVGCGSSYHACLYGAALLQNLGTLAQAIIASEGDTILSTVQKGTLVIAISQSGETIDTLDFVMAARVRGAKIISLTNVEFSTLDRLADLRLSLGSGKEIAVASTKAYISMLLFFVELSLHMGNKTDDYRSKYLSATQKLLSQTGRHQTERLAKELSKLDHLYVVGRGDLTSIAMEAALKFKEIGYLHAEAIVAGEFKHGPLALIEDHTPVLVIKRVGDPMIEHTMSEIKARGGKVLVVDLMELGMYTPLYGATLIHLISFCHSLLMGINPDMPRNLAKSVTVK